MGSIPTLSNDSQSNFRSSTFYRRVPGLCEEPGFGEGNLHSTANVGCLDSAKTKAAQSVGAIPTLRPFERTDSSSLVCFVIAPNGLGFDSLSLDSAATNLTQITYDWCNGSTFAS